MEEARVASYLPIHLADRLSTPDIDHILPTKPDATPYGNFRSTRAPFHALCGKVSHALTQSVARIPDARKLCLLLHGQVVYTAATYRVFDT